MRVLLYLGMQEWSGCARAMLVVARGLSARGHQITIACCPGTRLHALASEAAIDIAEIKSGSWAAAGSLDLRRVLKDRFIEVAVVSTERDHLIVASAMRAAGRGGVLRRVPSFGALNPQRGGWLATKLAASGAVVTTQSELAALRLPGWAIPPAVAPLGVDAASYDDTEPVSRAAINASERGLLIACNYDPSGRIRLGSVFRTVALLGARHAGLHVAVFGPGSKDDELRMHAAALGVGPAMSFLGERHDELGIMRAADAGWVVSGGDTAAFACLDFMALRVPVIADRWPLTQHYVADRISGVLLAPGDPSYTAAGVAAFLTAEDKRKAMGNAGRTRVQRDFPETSMIDGFVRAVTAAGDRSVWTTR
jgi:hypothetical protein